MTMTRAEGPTETSKSNKYLRAGNQTVRNNAKFRIQKVYKKKANLHIIRFINESVLTYRANIEKNRKQYTQNTIKMSYQKLESKKSEAREKRID
jgi:hypothetical protein